MSAKEFSVRIAYACFRYALGGRDSKYSAADCIEWLRLVTDGNYRRAALSEEKP